MSGRSSKKVALQTDEAALVVVPAGVPAWITPELIEETIKVWQPYYPEVISPEEAITMIQSAGRLFQALSSGDSS